MREKLPTFSELEAMLTDCELNGEMYGWCTCCGEITHDCCEPDVSEAQCPACDEFTVYAPFELLVSGKFEQCD